MPGPVDNVKGTQPLWNYAGNSNLKEPTKTNDEKNNSIFSRFDTDRNQRINAEDAGIQTALNEVKKRVEENAKNLVEKGLDMGTAFKEVINKEVKFVEINYVTNNQSVANANKEAETQLQNIEQTIQNKLKQDEGTPKTPEDSNGENYTKNNV